MGLDSGVLYLGVMYLGVANLDSLSADIFDLGFVSGVVVGVSCLAGDAATLGFGLNLRGVTPVTH